MKKTQQRSLTNTGILRLHDQNSLSWIYPRITLCFSGREVFEDLLICHFCSLPALLENCPASKRSSWEGAGVSSMCWPPMTESYSQPPVLRSSPSFCFIRQICMTSDQWVKCEVETFQELLCGGNPSSPCQRNFAISSQREVANLVMV